jgi:hypothetical protein
MIIPNVFLHSPRRHFALQTEAIAFQAADASLPKILRSILVASSSSFQQVVSCFKTHGCYSYW